MLNIQFTQAQEEAEARDLGIGLLRSPDELSDGEKGILQSSLNQNSGELMVFILFLFMVLL